MIVEVGLLLLKPYSFYKELLKQNGLDCVFECIIHDIYFTTLDISILKTMSEKAIKDACVRIRQDNKGNCEIQNFPDDNYKKLKLSKLPKFINKLEKQGYKKVFDTVKIDHHWFKCGMTSRIQLQEIQNVGLMVYFDNEQYYHFSLDEQREKLIDELNSYGFNIKYDTLGLDKLRTFLFDKPMYSKNQNA